MARLQCYYCDQKVGNVGDLTRHNQRIHNIVEFTVEWDPCQEQSDGETCGLFKRNEKHRTQDRQSTPETKPRHESHKHATRESKKLWRPQPQTNQEMYNAFQLSRYQKLLHGFADSPAGEGHVISKPPKKYEIAWLRQKELREASSGESVSPEPQHDQAPSQDQWAVPEVLMQDLPPENLAGTGELEGWLAVQQTIAAAGGYDDMTGSNQLDTQQNVPYHHMDNFHAVPGEQNDVPLLMPMLGYPRSYNGVQGPYEQPVQPAQLPSSMAMPDYPGSGHGARGTQVQSIQPAQQPFPMAMPNHHGLVYGAQGPYRQPVQTPVIDNIDPRLLGRNVDQRRPAATPQTFHPSLQNPGAFDYMLGNPMLNDPSIFEPSLQYPAAFNNMLDNVMENGPSMDLFV